MMLNSRTFETSVLPGSAHVVLLQSPLTAIGFSECWYTVVVTVDVVVGGGGGGSGGVICCGGGPIIEVESVINGDAGGFLFLYGRKPL